MKTPQKILVPTDFSKYADKALQEGLLMAKQFNAELDVVHVVHDIQQCAADYCLEDKFVREYRESGIESSKQKLKETLDKFPEAKGIKISTNVRVGYPDEEILKEEKEKNIDLVVIATHGKSGILQHLMGSVADRVSHGAKSEVLLVRA